MLGEYGCAPADRDVRSVPDAGMIERTLANGDRVESVGAGGGLNLTVEGSLLNASASRFAGGPDDLPEVSVEGDTVRVTDPRRAPFRLWIDAVSGDGTVVRTELDVCPPDDPQ